jgi:hypothetical protein
MLIPSIWVGMAGMVAAAILMAANWQIWESRYRISRQGQSGLDGRMGADRRQTFHVRSASGRELVATLAAQSADCNLGSLNRLTGRLMDRCSQG